MAEKVVEFQVIPQPDGKTWTVVSSKDPTAFTVESVDRELVCNCDVGLSGKFCQHKRAVANYVDAAKMREEHRLSGEPAPAQPKKGQNDKFTKNGYVFGEVTSAVQKSIRRGDVREAVYWALELYEAAPHYLAKRLVVIASEDVGMAAPEVVVAANTLILGWANAKRFSWYCSPHALTQAVVMLCRAPKSTEIEDLQAVTYLDLKEKRRRIPADAVDMHTARGKAQAKAEGKTYDDQCQDWYAGRIAAGIPLNQYTQELFDRAPQWAPPGV